MLKDETCLRCSPVLWSASVTPSRILQLAGVCAALVPGQPELQNCTENHLGVLTGPGQIMPEIVLTIYWYRESSLKTQECILALLNLLVKTKPLVPHALNK